MVSAFAKKMRGVLWASPSADGEFTSAMLSWTDCPTNGRCNAILPRRRPPRTPARGRWRAGFGEVCGDKTTWACVCGGGGALFVGESAESSVMRGERRDSDAPCVGESDNRCGGDFLKLARVRSGEALADERGGDLVDGCLSGTGSGDNNGSLTSASSPCILPPSPPEDKK
eukprot:Hpha_TRINITY_DN34395_c0_g1::TRINITY_DN34395_c0_g1_i1::g.109500::m.109500